MVKATRIERIDVLCPGYTVHTNGRWFYLHLSGPYGWRSGAVVPVFDRYSKRYPVPKHADITQEWAASVMADPSLAPPHGPWDNLYNHNGGIPPWRQK
jgi:hypothetical protein